MKKKTYQEIIDKLSGVKLKENYDLIIGIAQGGIVPAYLLASYHSLPLEFIWIKFRDELHRPKGKPRLLKPLNFNWKNKRILLVDDRSKTGITIKYVQQLLKGAKKIKTLVINGKADYALFDEDCFRMPWDVKKISGRKQ